MENTSHWFLLALILTTAALLALAFAFSAGAVMLRIRNTRRGARWKALEEVWEPLLLDVLTGDVPPTALTGMVGPDDRRYFVGFMARYSRRLRGGDPSTIEQVVAPFLASIVPDLTHRNGGRRARAIQTLGILGPDQYADRLIETLDDPSPWIAMVAVQTLTDRPNPPYLGALIDRLGRFQSYSIKYLAALFERMGPDVSPHLRLALLDAERPLFTRQVAARALWSLKDSSSVGVAGSLIDRADHPELVAAALDILGSVGSAEHVPAVRGLLGSPSAFVRAHAATAFSRIGAPSDAGQLAPLLHDDTEWVARRAAMGLRYLGRQDLLEEAAGQETPAGIWAREAIEARSVG